VNRLFTVNMLCKLVAYLSEAILHLLCCFTASAKAERCFCNENILKTLRHSALTCVKGQEVKAL